jgi:hypothetical protein
LRQKQRVSRRLTFPPLHSPHDFPHPPPTTPAVRKPRTFHHTFHVPSTTLPQPAILPLPHVDSVGLHRPRLPLTDASRGLRSLILLRRIHRITGVVGTSEAGEAVRGNVSISHQKPQPPGPKSRLTTETSPLALFLFQVGITTLLFLVAMYLWHPTHPSEVYIAGLSPAQVGLVAGLGVIAGLGPCGMKLGWGWRVV